MKTKATRKFQKNLGETRLKCKIQRTLEYNSGYPRCKIFIKFKLSGLKCKIFNGQHYILELQGVLNKVRIIQHKQKMHFVTGP